MERERLTKERGMDQSVLRQRKWSTNVFGGGKPQMKEITWPIRSCQLKNKT